MPTPTPNMKLPVPIVNVTPGSDYATQEVQCFNQIDSHDHTANKGVAIPTAGLNINADLSLNNFALSSAKNVNLVSQTTTQPNQSLYVNGVDLWYRDGGGTNVRITSGGSVTGASGTITGLPSAPPKNASVAFVDATNSFKFQSDTNIAGIIDCGDLWMRNAGALSYKMVVSAPTLGADTSIVLPARPAVTSIVTMDASGNMSSNYVTDNVTLEVSANTLQVKNLGITAGKIANATITQSQMANNSIGTAQIIDANVTRAKLAALGEQISSASGTFTTTSASAVDVTNLTVTITTTGRPVMLMLFGGTLRLTGTSGTEYATIALVRDVITTVSGYTFGLSDIRIPASSVNAIDVVAAGTYVYKVTLQTILACPASVIGAKLVAYEL